MSKSENNYVKKKPTGRPATGKGKMISVRLHGDLLGPLDAFARTVEPGPINRPEAIRRILRERLAGLIV